ncbi:MAG TPA: 4-hydroxy-3-methylbut-2-enyl diphosphate reductase [Fimbriimonadaceae bacterium]|nr:4-hydroxy-3-methylbut-2-enyl diphosphate reductase [Armatimonadota bacterium]HCM73107.1 4-hydroxy-3-methylbut-2-enyl diphosphate reductase [Armatimonadota bacterium]HRD30317.1 4-hydroxy-3-methylbut-2-enyl diphosphate reductase [Fimbriimonadaceae bacterium]HRE94047.1 4-hydroxy-3-methylbut-2-enyl diphosphate reductase [Fimbriimonadaceae bacterium]HRI74923.1 4-hydroxy-3-methylbut-2-enyl diphosphate reductase [Fimbriimonadaceae bacterium]
MERILLAAPRGFCAGVAFAIEVVELALKVHGAPLYVRHAIVHNEHVVRKFEAQGVIFVEDVNEIPEGSAVVFSAHGVSPAVRATAKARNLTIIDATCPLVTKVHNEARRFAEKDYLMIYIGHRGHVEAEGTMGEAPDRMILVETPEEAEVIELPPHERLAVVTQTTLSIDEVMATMTVLRRRFPHMETAKKEDICYATTNRQGAMKAMAATCDVVLVVGSTLSSNSNRLREVAEALGPRAYLLLNVSELQDEWLEGARTVGVSSGASTPDELVEELLGELLRRSPDAKVETLETVRETMEFRPPRDLINLAMSKS